MVPHQAVDVAPPPLLLNLSTEQSEELQAIRVIHKDGLLGIAAGCDVVKRIGKFKAERAGHEAAR
jgi:hypothetical protein